MQYLWKPQFKITRSLLEQYSTELNVLITSYTMRQQKGIEYIEINNVTYK